MFVSSDEGDTVLTSRVLKEVVRFDVMVRHVYARMYTRILQTPWTHGRKVALAIVKTNGNVL